MAIALDRFREPDEVEVVVARCDHCGDELWNYQEVIEAEGELFCDDACLLEWFKDGVGARTVTAGEAVAEYAY